MSANKDDIVLLHPPQEQGFAGHPRIWGNCSYLRCFAWSREPFCSSWCIRRKSIREQGQWSLLPDRKPKEKEYPFRLVICKKDFSFISVLIPDWELQTTVFNTQGFTESLNHTFMGNQNFKIVHWVLKLLNCEKWLWTVRTCCPNTNSTMNTWNRYCNNWNTEHMQKDLGRSFLALWFTELYFQNCTFPASVFCMLMTLVLTVPTIKNRKRGFTESCVAVVQWEAEII